MSSGSQTQKLASLARSSTKLLDRPTRKYATHADLPRIQPAPKKTINPFITRVVATTYKWPSIQPSNLVFFSGHHLDVPLRKDILHRAVVYEADNRRAGLASTKHRSNMRGSDRKLRPQKGTGRARLSDRKSPMLRGGGVAHGPHPRDFSTELPSKVYELAFRTALSHRYRKGELIILGGSIRTEDSDQGPRWLHNIFAAHEWGAGHGRTMVVVSAHKREAETTEMLKQIGQDVVVRNTEEVEVKDLLSCSRVLIELPALRNLLARTSEDIKHLIVTEFGRLEGVQGQQAKEESM